MGLSLVRAQLGWLVIVRRQGEQSMERDIDEHIKKIGCKTIRVAGHVHCCTILTLGSGETAVITTLGTLTPQTRVSQGRLPPGRRGI